MRLASRLRVFCIMGFPHGPSLEYSSYADSLTAQQHDTVMFQLVHPKTIRRQLTCLTIVLAIPFAALAGPDDPAVLENKKQATAAMNRLGFVMNLGISIEHADFKKFWNANPDA